jgi:hypothetical protein
LSAGKPVYHKKKKRRFEQEKIIAFGKHLCLETADSYSERPKTFLA